MRSIVAAALALLLGWSCAAAQPSPPAARDADVAGQSSGEQRKAGLAPDRNPSLKALPASCIAGDKVAIDPAAGPFHLGTQSYPQSLKLCDHYVVLTFDDGPWPGTTPLILDALKQADVKATFFLIGRNACLHPKLARRELAEGHSVGHHSDTHPSFTLRGFDEASAERDIENGIAADEAVIYGPEARPDHPHVPFFRFPGFADSAELLHYLDRRGIAVFGSDLWAGDWIAMSPDHERERILAILEKRPLHNGIILLHDIKASTARMLPDLLRELKAKGYHFVQPVYEAGAPAPPLTVALPGEPETQKIIANLPAKIVAGSHHLRAAQATGCRIEAEALGGKP